MRQIFKSEPNKNPAWRGVVDRAIAAINEAAWRGDAFQIAIGPILRTLDQNAAMWPSLTDICKQVPLVIHCRNGSVREATPYDWKDVLTAAFEEETEWAPGLRGGVVYLGARTSKYGKRKMGEFLTFVHAEGSERGVVWSDRALEDLATYAPRERAA